MRVDQPIVLATRSEGKRRELVPLLAAAGLTCIDLRAAGVVESPDEDALEVFSSFEENALAKARYFFAKTGKPVLADDSGLCVDALAGRPGVLSKRWSGRSDLSGQALDDENNRLLLERLGASRGSGERRAHYVCAAAFTDGQHELVCRGQVQGYIVDRARGNGGFGYDPYFFADELSKTFGEASVMEKERVSHRGRAFRALISELERS